MIVKLDRISTGLLVILMVLSALLYGQYAGFAAGNDYCQAYHKTIEGCVNFDFIVHGPSTYALAANPHWYIAALTILLLALQLLLSLKYRFVPSLIVLAFLLTQYMQVHRTYSFAAEKQIRGASPIFALIDQTIYLNIVSFATALSVLTILVVSVAVLFYERDKKIDMIQ